MASRYDVTHTTNDTVVTIDIAAMTTDLYIDYMFHFFLEPQTSYLLIGQFLRVSKI